MSANQQTWFGQPRGLTILFLTEMWEIFSYYGMRTLLVYYMTKQLLIGQEKASLIYGTYTAMAYFTPIFGGLIADRWLGKRRAVIIGGGIMAAGHFMMTFEPLFYVALATIATFILLFAVVLAVTVFRGAYEQVGNTVALWADVGIDRSTALMTIPMTWFQSLNPLLVIMMTPLLLAHWRRRTQAGFAGSAMRKMALGALIVAAAYLLLTTVAFQAGTGRASWLWLAIFFAVFTLGELYILPTGLGLFARLAPIGYGATTVAAWFCAIFTGSFSAGMVGTLWARTSHAEFFAILTLISTIAAVMLFALDRPIRRIEAARAAETIALNATQPELA